MDAVLATVKVVDALVYVMVPLLVFRVSVRPPLLTPVPPYVELITTPFHVPDVIVPNVVIEDDPVVGIELL